MNNLKIMHLSDLHYSSKNKKEIIDILEGILFDIDNFIIKKNLRPNIIVFSGDLLFKPDTDISSIDLFKESYENFIKPILDKLNLDENSFFITSGNHDINRDVLTKYDINGLSSYRDTEHKGIEELLKEITERKIELKHLKQYNQFLKSLNNDCLIYTDDLTQVYKYSFDCSVGNTVSIGIISLNSNILAFNDSTYGNLIIGKDQLINSYEKIKDCDIKIANIHHSTNWLVWFEQLYVKRFFYKNFNLVFLGHEHSEQSELVKFSDEDTMILNSASIFQGKKNINGYSIIDYSFEKNLADIYIREFNDRENKFSNITFRDVESKYTYDFNILSKSKSKKNIELIIDELSLNLKETIKKELLINTAKGENNSIEEIFVEPDIYNKSEFIEGSNNDEKNHYKLNEILNFKKPIVLKGVESSGKTTLLNYIANEFLNYNSNRKKIPIILNKYDIHDYLDEHILFSKTIDFLRKNNVTISNKELLKLFKDGDFVFLIDNITESEKCIEFLDDVVVNINLKNNKFIFTSKEDIFNSLDKTVNEKSFKNNKDLLELYIHNLKRAKAREFFKIYFKKQLDTDEFEIIFNFISKLHIPLTIFNYTIIALTYELQKVNFKPINEAYLLDVFMENLLEKLDVQKNMYIGSLGYSLKADYLIYISKWMVMNNEFSIDRYKLISLTSEFIYKLRREKEKIDVESFILYLENKGIFVNAENNHLRFRYNAFLEFFIAKGMLVDNELKNYILSEERFLDYINEINYYSGLHGEDENLINQIKTYLDNYSEYFSQIEYNEGKDNFIPEINVKNDKEIIKVEQIDFEKKDKYFEQRISNIKIKNEMKCVENSNKIDIKDTDISKDKTIFNTNLILSRVIRNSEKLKNPILKTEMIELVSKNFSKFFQYFLNINKKNKNEILEGLKGSDNFDIEKEETLHLISLLNLVFSQAFMNIIQNNLVSDSLYSIHSDTLDKTVEDNVLKLIIGSTMIYKNSTDAILHIEKIINDKSFSSNRYLMMAFFYKIFNAIKFREIDNTFKNKLEKLLTDIIINLQYKGYKETNIQFSGMQKRMNIEGNRKEISKKIKESINEENELN